MKLNIYETVDELLQKLAEFIVEAAAESIKDYGRFTVALSGGSSPENLYKLLASDNFRNAIEWKNVYFFLGDERYVPLTDNASNYKMINRVLFQPLQIDWSQIFPVDTTHVPEDAAVDYMKEISNYFDGLEPRFDLVLLGLGDNSHTASLFPHTEILHETSATVRSVFLKDQQVYRISFTAPLINKAYRVAFLVYGEAKAEAVQTILEGMPDIENFPAQLIQPDDGELEWFLDKTAASKIKLTA
ncbi:MAG: pgl [Ferruginibacter sp.]|nr:pgl [Ferruginibacter sp.]